MHTTVFRLVLMITVVQIIVAPHGIALAAVTPQEAARGLIQRIVPTKADQFLLEAIPAENGRDVFEIENRDGKVVIRGSSGVAIASGWKAPTDGIRSI